LIISDMKRFSIRLMRPCIHLARITSVRKGNKLLEIRKQNQVTKKELFFQWLSKAYHMDMFSDNTNTYKCSMKIVQSTLIYIIFFFGPFY